MASFTEEQLRDMTAVITATLRQLHGANMFGLGNHGQGGNGRVVLDERHFRRLEKFSNKESDWDAWEANV